MDFDTIDVLLSNSVTVKLIRAQNAPLILSFLHQEFKVPNRMLIPNHELVTRLSDFMGSVGFNETEETEDVQELNEEDSREAQIERARKYLDQWTEQNFLRKFPDETGEHIHELTSHTEKAFQWLETLEKKEFVGTESRFKDIFKKLRDLVENSTEDPIEKIKELERKKEEIEAEIRQIKITRSVITFNETQIKERYFEVNRIARELLADFKEVEQNFKDIIRNIYEKQSDSHFTKGYIIGYALDAIEELKQKDQGKSFYAFWQFLIADKSQEELKDLIESVYALMDEKGIDVEDDRFLRRIKSSLHAAGKKVIESNRHLSAKLSKVLAERDMVDRKKAMELIAEIRNHALKVVKAPPKDDNFIIIDGFTEVNLVMNRPLGEEPHEPAVKNHPSDVASSEILDLNLDSLFSQFAINKTLIQGNISELLKDKNQVSLGDVLEKHPIQKGLAELLTYLSIASQSNKHIISDVEFEVLPLSKKEKRFVRVPQVIYTK